LGLLIVKSKALDAPGRSTVTALPVIVNGVDGSVVVVIDAVGVLVVLIVLVVLVVTDRGAVVVGVVDTVRTTVDVVDTVRDTVDVEVTGATDVEVWRFVIRVVVGVRVPGRVVLGTVAGTVVLARRIVVDVATEPDGFGGATGDAFVVTENG
jgi:hypothetical protein